MNGPALEPPGVLLVPVDLSPRSLEGVSYAVWLARQVDAEVVLTINLNRPEEACLRDRRPDWSGSLAELARIELVRWAADELGGLAVGVIATEHLEPADGILAAVDQAGADAIVIGTHGRSMASHWILGSVTERVIRDSPVPIFVVPSHVSVPEQSECTT